MFTVPFNGSNIKQRTATAGTNCIREPAGTRQRRAHTCSNGRQLMTCSLHTRSVKWVTHTQREAAYMQLMATEDPCSILLAHLP